jgi:hypothetical protein
MYRLLVVEPRLPRKPAPQLAVLVSSPAVLGASWYTLTGSADAVTVAACSIATVAGWLRQNAVGPVGAC